MRASASDPTLNLIERSAENTEAVRTGSAIGLDRDPARGRPSPAGGASPGYCAHDQRNDVQAEILYNYLISFKNIIPFQLSYL